VILESRQAVQATGFWCRHFRGFESHLSVLEMWRSLVAHLFWVQGAGGSNPPISTCSDPTSRGCRKQPLAAHHLEFTKPGAVAGVCVCSDRGGL
jgi:hypothetical protein